MAARSVVRTPVRGVVSSGLRLPSPLSFMPLRINTALLIGSGSETFARGSAATFKPTASSLDSAATNIPRFEGGKLLMEGAGKNWVLHSDDYTDVVWTKRGATAIVANDAIGPDGSTLMDKMTTLGTVGNDIFQVSTSNSGSGVEYSPSIWFKRTTTTGILRIAGAGAPGEMRIDLSTLPDALIRLDQNTPNMVAIAPFTTTTSDDVGVQLAMLIGTADAHISSSQAENLAFTSSYMGTGAATATRSADSLDIAAANIPGPTADYTVSLECDHIGLDAALSQALFNVEGETSRKIEWDTTTGAIKATHGAVTSVSTSTFSVGDDVKIAFVVDGTNQTLYINGVQEDQDVKGTVTGTATLVNIGHAANADEAYSHITNVKTFGVALSANQVKGL